ncbi:hypothetical protein RchiOBHm_Chr7g0224571 [Rosa chinensis]|uniref:Uncharacterized protein n=2 Tax=Rosa chinensis TaxID=74649 RepID=A0A2P6PDW4_ROSCH|nr:hypothetical protein RchiOBHm_Chr7g0224571 [Rosa chinensis]
MVVKNQSTPRQSDKTPSRRLLQVIGSHGKKSKANESKCKAHKMTK